MQSFTVITGCPEKKFLLGLILKYSSLFRVNFCKGLRCPKIRFFPYFSPQRNWANFYPVFMGKDMEMMTEMMLDLPVFRGVISDL